METSWPCWLLTNACHKSHAYGLDVMRHACFVAVKARRSRFSFKPRSFVALVLCSDRCLLSEPALLVEVESRYCLGMDDRRVPALPRQASSPVGTRNRVLENLPSPSVPGPTCSSRVRPARKQSSRSPETDSQVLMGQRSVVEAQGTQPKGQRPHHSWPSRHARERRLVPSPPPRARSQDIYQPTCVLLFSGLWRPLHCRIVR